MLSRIDQDVTEIAALYESGGSSFVDAVTARLECGRRLALKKDELGHGDWLPWLKENQNMLGFGRLAASRMVKAAKRSPATLLLKNEEQALQISKGMWGHKPKKESGATKKKKPQTTTVEYILDEDAEEEDQTPLNQLPDHMRVRGFVHRANESTENALADDLSGVKITKGMITAARKAVKAWTTILNRMEKENG